MHPHAPGQQAGGHLVPAHSERHDPPKLWKQRRHEAPRELSAHRGIGIATDHVDSKVSRVATAKVGWRGREGGRGGGREGGASHGQGRRVMGEGVWMRGDSITGMARLRRGSGHVCAIVVVVIGDVRPLLLYPCIKHTKSSKRKAGIRESGNHHRTQTGCLKPLLSTCSENCMHC